ncbi:unnamed protein product [Polarella glacialis]|uniref:Glycosyl hydrolase family 30 TIM-barrel domain-containing protein n=1 Tax=Polarella glacialis TaxID=89957 RepID=A0A813FTV4_POLGL|nr:unnamed protein product [Polarella glacialis]
MIITSQAEDDASKPHMLKVMDSEVVSLSSGGAPGDALWQMTLEPSNTLQQIIGFGGAFTDAVAYNYEILNEDLQAVFIDQYFGKGGIGYSTGRVPMNSADFSRMDYTLDNISDDFDLEHFCLRDDSAVDVPCGTDYKISVIKAAAAAAKEASGVTLQVFASAWTAPLWLKDQKFECDNVDCVSVCKNGSSAPAFTCSKAVLDPKACEINSQGEPCPQADLPQSFLQTEAPSVSQMQQASALKDQEALKDRAKARAGVKGVSTMDESAKCKDTPAKPPDNAKGNCFNTGFLPGGEKLQATWAKLFSKFIAAYKEQGADLWGVTVQNEPLTQTGLWQSLFQSPQLQAQFVAKHLGPTLHTDHPGIKIMIHDDQTSYLDTFAKVVLEELKEMGAEKYVDGVAYHWYTSLEGSYEDDKPIAPFKAFDANVVGGGGLVPDILSLLQSMGPDKFVLPSEACNGYVLGQPPWVGPMLGLWGYGYAYSHDILWQLRNGASGWTDWNLMLNMNGGPNLAGNFVDAPILAAGADMFYQSPVFFHLAHFSKYIPRGSVGIGGTTKKCSLDCSGCDIYCNQYVAFKTPSKQIVVVITNDEITVGPVPELFADMNAKGYGSFAAGHVKYIPWAITCGSKTISGTAEWKSIQTVIFNEVDCA